MTDRDTIFATSTGNPPAAIAIVRISGPAARATAAALAGPLPEPRHAALRALQDPRDGGLLDRALVLVFAEPRTATGEDLVELHVHGGRAVVAAVEAAIDSRPGTRRAEPGEFTRRALENGVIDLIAAEGLGDLLSAETESQRRAALRMTEGGLRATIDRWTDRLLGIAARVEAQLDFSDEDDVTDDPAGAIGEDILAVADEIAHMLSAPPVERLHDGIRVVIAGPPNSGKSTLLNVLTGREVAIVSPLSGTTRDRIEAPVQRGGIAYVLTDTAGLTDCPGDDVERIGVDRAAQAMAGADILLWLGDTDPPARDYFQIQARADLPERGVALATTHAMISAKTGFGIDMLWRLIEDRAHALLPQTDVVGTNQRQRAILATCLTHLQSTGSSDPLIVAEELRCALRSLDAVAGRSGIENVLDMVFSRFCIGK